MARPNYINSKLLDAIIALTMCVGDAKTRIAKIIPKIKILSVSSFPIELQDDFNWVKTTVIFSHFSRTSFSTSLQKANRRQKAEKSLPAQGLVKP